MADVDVLAARRERRQRRILENADRRMRSFKNIQKSIDEEFDKASSSPYESLIDNSKFNPEPPVTCSTAPECAASTTNRGSEESEVLDEENLFGSMTTLKATQETPISSDSYRQIIIFFLGLTIRYINLIFEKGEDIVGVDLSYLHLHYIFLPFILYEITEYFLFCPTEDAKYINLILALINIEGNWVNAILMRLKHLLRVVKDMPLYLFAYIFLDMVFALFNVDEEVV